MNAYHLLIIKCTCQDITFHAILDTGAQSNVMNADLAVKLDSRIDRSQKTTMSGVGQLTTMGSITKTFCIPTHDGNDIQCDGIHFTVLHKRDDPFLCILGTPFMAHYNTVLHLRDRYAVIQSQTIHFLPFNEVQSYNGPYNVKEREIAGVLKSVRYDTKEFILKVINNILAHPKEEKYKIINAESNQYKKNVPDNSILTCMGFVLCDGKMVFADTTKTLEQAKEVLSY